MYLTTLIIVMTPISLLFGVEAGSDSDKADSNTALSEDQRFTVDCDGKVIHVKTLMDRRLFPNLCANPREQVLVQPKVFPLRGLRSSEFSSIVTAKYLRMCIHIEMSTVKLLDFGFVKNITPTCEGPAILIAQNPALKEVIFNVDFLNNVPPKTIFIRGNRKLRRGTIDHFNRHASGQDFQIYGECSMPSAFWSFEQLSNCTSVYGTLFVNDTTVEIPAAKNNISFTGCILIVDSLLKNVDFLDNFVGFEYERRLCDHEISGNKDLCIKEPMELRKRFRGVLIEQPRHTDCTTTCGGGEVDDQYLLLVDGCDIIQGDMVIYNWTALPKNVDNLRSVRQINGSLRIANTSNLGTFDYFSNLEEVGSTSEGDDLESVPAVEVIGNEALDAFKLPLLKKVHSTNPNKIVIIENPSLGMKRSEVLHYYEVADGPNHVLLEYRDTTTFLDEVLSNGWFFVRAFFILLLLLLLVFMAMMVVREKLKFMTLPPPPYILSKKSRTLLECLVKEIVTCNPLIWRCNDREFVWGYQQPEAAHADVNVLVANNETFLKSYMLTLAPNGFLPKNNKSLTFERVKALMSNDVCIVIGNEKCPDCVIENLPIKPAGEHSYIYSGNKYSFKLKKVKQMGPCTTGYLYLVKYGPKEASVSEGKKSKKEEKRKMVLVHYYQWDNGVMPQGLHEILQLAVLCEPGKAICISNRRKEVFSMIHMFFTYIYVIKETIGLKDAFQLHTEKCNGSIMDRTEMLFVMAIIMEWAYQTRSIPETLIKKHTEWCQTYSIMNIFMKENKNIKLIHPDYLTKLDPEVKQEVLSVAYLAAPRFSNREFGAVKDAFHRKPVAERPKPAAKPGKDTPKGEDESEADPVCITDENPEFWNETMKTSVTGTPAAAKA
ncbi:hypothetical protein RB195_004097 [Necator americanus]|uniref:Receptor L-domain domain-containing protein n=1 Tax=Necator americanus TaxID=51031 RepID=A0ABR1BGC4_NECAM